jgi:hypothetical protein
MQKFRERGCKKIVDHYNAIPSLKQLIARLGFDQRTLIFDFVGWFTRSHNFSQLPGSLLRNQAQFISGAWLHLVAQGNPGDRPRFGPLRQKITLKTSLQAGSSGTGPRVKCFLKTDHRHV